MKNYALVFISLIFLLLLSRESTVTAQIKSPQYQINDQTIQLYQSTDAMPNQAIILPLSQEEKELFEENGYLSYESKEGVLSFNISSGLLVFDNLVEGKPISASTDFVVMSKSSLGYQVNLTQKEPLSDFEDNVIKNATCKNGCTKNSAGIWDTNSDEGVGYNLSGNAPVDFQNDLYFRALPFDQNQVSSVVLMSSDRTHSGKTSMTVKIHPSSKTTGVYSTTLKVQALPGY